MRIAGIVACHVFVVLVTVLCGLRWGLPTGSDGGSQYVMPLLPVVAIVIIALRAPGAVPSWLVFGCGVMMDLLLQGPLGFWALIYLCALLGVRAAPVSLLEQLPGRAAWITLIAVGLVLLQWIVASGYLWAGVEVWPLMWAGVVVWMCTLAVDAIVILAGALELRVGPSSRLVRGGD